MFRGTSVVEVDEGVNGHGAAGPVARAAGDSPGGAVEALPAVRLSIIISPSKTSPSLQGRKS